MMQSGLPLVPPENSIGTSARRYASRGSDSPRSILPRQQVVGYAGVAGGRKTGCAGHSEPLRMADLRVVEQRRNWIQAAIRS